MQSNEQKPCCPDQSDVRWRIMECAMKLFAEKGYAATSVREIVSAAGVTAPVLYYYFGNKEGVFLEIMREGRNQYEKILVNVGEMEGSAREKIEYLAASIYRLHIAHLDAVRIVHAAYYGPPGGAPKFDLDEFHDNLAKALRSILAGGMDSGELALSDVETASQAVLGVIHYGLDMELCHPGNSLGEGGIIRLLDTLFLGLLPRNSIKGD